MDIKEKKDTVLCETVKLCDTVEQGIECEINLPDYCGEITKVISCNADVNIYSAEVSEDRADISGCISVKFLYQTEDGTLSLYDTSQQFSKSLEYSGCTSADIIKVSGSTEHLTCKAVSQRKAEIRGSAAIRITVMQLTEKNYISACENSNVRLLTEKTEGSFTVAAGVRTFSVSESFDVNASQSKPDKIFRTSVHPRITEVRTIKDKMMIKGICMTDTVYTDDEKKFCRQSESISFNQILDMEGVTETSVCDVSLCVRSAEGTVSAESGSPNGRYEISAVIEADVRCYEKKELEYTADAFSPKCSLETGYTELDIYKNIQHISDSCSVSSEASFKSGSIKEIKDFSVTKLRYTPDVKNGEAVYTGELFYGITAELEDGGHIYTEKKAEFEYKKAVPFGNDAVCITSEIFAGAMNTALIDHSAVSVSIELRIDSYVAQIESQRVMSDIVCKEEYSANNNKTDITVYFAQKGERLWDIAKRYRSSVDSIKAMNGLDSDILNEDKTLILSDD